MSVALSETLCRADRMRRSAARFGVRFRAQLVRRRPMSDCTVPAPSALPASDGGLFSWNPVTLGAQLQAARAAQGSRDRAPSCLHKRDLRHVNIALVKACDSEELIEVPREALVRADCAWGKQLCCVADARWAPCGCPFWALSERRAVVLAVCRALQSGAFALPEGVSMEEVERACGEIGLALRAVACDSQAQPKRRKIVASQLKIRAQEWKAGIRELAIEACMSNETARINVWSSDPLCPTIDVMLWAPAEQDDPLLSLCDLAGHLCASAPTERSVNLLGKFDAFAKKASSSPRSLRFCYTHAFNTCIQLLDEQGLLGTPQTQAQVTEVLAKHGPCVAQHLLGPLIERSALGNFILPLRAFLGRLKAVQDAPRGCSHAQLLESMAQMTRVEHALRDADACLVLREHPDWFEVEEAPVLPSWWWTTAKPHKDLTKSRALEDAFVDTFKKLKSWIAQMTRFAQASTTGAPCTSEAMEQLLYNPEPAAVACAIIFVLTKAITTNIEDCVRTLKRSQRSVDYFCEQIGAASGMRVEMCNRIVQTVPKPLCNVPGLQPNNSGRFGVCLPDWLPRRGEAITYLRFAVAFNLDAEAGGAGDAVGAGEVSREAAAVAAVAQEDGI